MPSGIHHGPSGARRRFKRQIDFRVVTGETREEKVAAREPFSKRATRPKSADKAKKNSQAKGKVLTKRPKKVRRKR